MHRLPVDTELISLNEVVLPREAAKHLKVLRPKPGEVVELFDGRGLVRRYAVDGTVLRAMADAALEPRPPVRLTLFACITKGSRWDWTIEKAVELGATRIVPVISDRVIVRLAQDARAEKAERWRRIAEEAARQSDAAWLPEIAEAVDFKDALPLVRATTCFVGALTAPPPPPLLDAVMAADVKSGGDYAVFVGPEGDFTPTELAALLEIAIPTSFGPTILRAETAAMFALSVLAARLALLKRT